MNLHSIPHNNSDDNKSLIPTFQDSSGHDGDVIPLREIMQEVEKTGMVDFELAGHTAVRPPAVCQGAESEDR